MGDVVRAARVGAASPTVVPDSIEELDALVAARVSLLNDCFS